MSYNSKYFDRKPGSLENAVLEALGGQINEASMDVNLDDDKRLIQNIEKMKVKVKILSRATSGRDRVDVRLTGSKNDINKVVDRNQTSMRSDNDFAFNESTEVVEAKMDKVNPTAVKKKFDDRKDKDIDNDGDVDSSDEYLHKRRKAVSKAIKSEEVKYPHKMYDPKTGKEVSAKTPEDHEKYNKMGYTHEKPEVKEEVNLDEGKMKELAGKIATVYKKMKSDSKMKPFADKFRADVKKSMNIRKSLEKVLPDYVGGGDITKLMSEASEFGTPERTKHTLDVTPGQSSEDWDKTVGIMREKNQTMRQALAKMWGVEESNNKNPFDEGGHLPSEKKNKKEQKTMTGQPATKVTVDPDMKEKKNIA